MLTFKINGMDVFFSDGRKGKVVDVESNTVFIRCEDGEEFAIDIHHNGGE